jgi:hypothetical protein
MTSGSGVARVSPCLLVKEVGEVGEEVEDEGEDREDREDWGVAEKGEEGEVAEAQAEGKVEKDGDADRDACDEASGDEVGRANEDEVGGMGSPVWVEDAGNEGVEEDEAVLLSLGPGTASG